MKKTMLQMVMVLVLSTSLTSCATLFGGKVTECQKTKPAAGEEKRKLRVGALVADILLFWPSVFVDLATGAIYKPCN